MHCECCNERVYESDFDASERDENTAAICEDCMEKSVHLRCMSLEKLAQWEETRIWHCLECATELENSIELAKQASIATLESEKNSTTVEETKSAECSDE